MSKIAITGAATGTATFTIESPATSTNRTLTIPDATTTIVGTDATQTLTNKTLTTPTLTTPNIDSAQVDTVSGTAPLYMARAWVNFNGTTNVGGNCTIRASGNVSTVADNNTGDYTVNFTTAMPDANYSVTSSGGAQSEANRNRAIGTAIYSTTSFRALSATIDTVDFVDAELVSLAIFR